MMKAHKLKGQKEMNKKEILDTLAILEKDKQEIENQGLNLDQYMACMDHITLRESILEENLKNLNRVISVPKTVK